MNTVQFKVPLSRRRWVRRFWSPLKNGLVKSLMKKASGLPWAVAGGRCMQLGFYKEDGGWYADIALWPGPQSACAMVAGADTMLDILSEGSDKVRLDLAFNREDLPVLTGIVGLLNFVRPDEWGDGGDYIMELPDHESFELWLCGVTEFVFGEMPPVIHFHVHNS